MALSDEDKKKIGGSDLASLLGISPYGSAYSVYERIVNGVEKEDNPHMSRGRRLEPVVLDWYSEHTGRSYTIGYKPSDAARPYLRCSLDALSFNGDGTSIRPVEAKTANSSQAHKWGEEGTDQIPPEYLVQCTYYLGFAREISGVGVEDVCDVPALISGDFRLYQVRFDPDVYGQLLETVERFWVDHILPKRPPDPTALYNDVEALAKRFRRHEGEQPLDYASLSPGVQSTLNNYLLAYGASKRAEKELALWEQRAKFAIGPTPGVSGLPVELGYSRLDWRQQKGREVTDWEEVARDLAATLDPLGTGLLERVTKHYTTMREGNRPLCPRAAKESSK